MVATGRRRPWLQTTTGIDRGPAPFPQLAADLSHVRFHAPVVSSPEENGHAEPAATWRPGQGQQGLAAAGHTAMPSRSAGVEPGIDERDIMRTRLMIMAIVLAAAAATMGVVVLLVSMLDWLGLAIGALGISFVLVAYRLWIQPWQHRWGATDEEVRRPMPGDDLIPDAASTTRAITIAAWPEDVWPWLVQLGYGRGGWYSYDWIDNDGQDSADRIIPELQQLQVDDQILMLPGMGPRVREVEPNRYFVAGDQEGGTWCLALYQVGGGCRLVSRWRVDWPLTAATAIWILLSDPGAFIMERKMLKGIRSRAEATVRAGDARARL
jgi:hypothetical protein